MKVIVDGAYRGDPRNHRDLKIKVNWEDQTLIEVDTDKLEFVLEANEYIRERMMDGLSGGLGLFEGIPVTMQTGNGIELEGYLDLTETELVGREEAICKFTPARGQDWLDERADSFSYPYLEELGIIKSSDFVRVPYVINREDGGLRIIVSSMSIFMMSKEIYESAKRISDIIALIKGSSLSPGLFISVIFETIALLVYIAGMLIAIVSLITTIFDTMQLIKRYHLGIRVRTLFQKGCEHLGIGYQSELLSGEWGNRVIIPQKQERGGHRNETGVPESTGILSTFGDVIRIFKQMYHAEHWIEDGVFRFEPVGYNQLNSEYVVPDTLTDQERLLDRYTLNGNEMVSNILISYAYDTTDENTLDNTDGMVFQAITSPRQIGVQENVTLKGFENVSIPFALAGVKTKLNPAEEALKVLGGIADIITGVFGKRTRFAKRMQNRVGAMTLTNHFITVPKIVHMEGANLIVKQMEKMSAKRLWDELHYTKSFVETNGVHNQWVIDKERRVQMSEEEFASLLKNRYCTNSSGEVARVDSLLWREYDKTADIVVRVNRKYTDNLKLEYVE